jgi:TolB-like protein
MSLPDRRDPIGPAMDRPIPGTLKKALTLMRQKLERPISMADLVKHCGVAERTLHKHFCAFFGLSPLRYLRQLRLAAVREALLTGPAGISVTEVAKRYGFAHLGRFSVHYRQCFGESPSTTVRRARAATLPDALKTYGSGQTKSSEAASDTDRFQRASRERPSIAVLPCQASAFEPTHGCFAESLAEGLAVALSSLRSLSVMVPKSPRTAMRDPRRSACELGARYVLTGRIMQAGTRLRLILRIVEAATGHFVWGDSYDGERDDLLALQDRVIPGVIGAVLPSIRGSEIDRARRAHPQDLDAYGLAMRALPVVFASRPDAARRALELLDRAMEIDPDYGLATALAAWCHGQLVMYNGTQAPGEERMCAVRLAQRASILDDDDPLVLIARCAVHTMVRDFDAAESLVARALALDPTSAWAWGRSGWLNSYRGASDAAIDHFGRAISLERSSPSNANNFVGIGSAHFDAGRYDAAAYWMRKALVEQPGTSWANRTLSVSLARLGDRLKAIESLDALRRYCPDLTVGQVVSAIPFRQHYLDRLAEGLDELGLPV